MKRETIFSPCRKYRYTLWREFEPELARTELQDSYVQFIGLNPSTADETNDDPTIRRCIAFARAWGYGAFCMTNVFSFRATDPQVMKENCTDGNIEAVIAHTNNLRQIGLVAIDAGLIVAAWGTHGSHLDGGNTVKTFIEKFGLKLHHLGLNSDGSPKHPLYLKKSTVPTIWR